MPVLAGLGGSHFDDFTGASFQHDKAILPQCRALDGICLRGPRAHTFKFSLKVSHVGLQAVLCHPNEQKKTREEKSTSNVTDRS